MLQTFKQMVFGFGRTLNVPALTETAPVTHDVWRRMNRRRILNRRRWLRFYTSKPRTVAQRKEAYETSLTTGLVIRGMERVGKHRSKYSPDVCQREGKR